MNSHTVFQPRLTLRSIVIGALLFVVMLVAAVIIRSMIPERAATRSGHKPSAPPRPIVQIVRPQSGLPDLSDLVTGLCPSLAIIVPHGQSVDDYVAGGGVPAAASVYSTDGWLVTSASALPAGPLDAVFGDGRRVEVDEQRSDPVSSLAAVKVTGNVTPLSFSDQAFPQVGQSGLLVDTPHGTGCSAFAAMIGSDFIADGPGKSGYVQLRPAPERWSAGMVLAGSDGALIGVASDQRGSILPGAITSLVLDELIRNSASPSIQFGFRAADFAPAVTGRLGDSRTGATVALVQQKSPADRAGLDAGDVVLAIGDTPVSSASELNRSLDASSGKVMLTVQRGGQTMHLTLRRKAAA